ncbi:twin-arginine translocase TatA/TatE family subunit [Actinomyces oris]|uniref:Sec-independent protein translocase protein TatB n=1 Tax=Actinomyces oris TaxID=544580 RepID=A0A1Q8HZT1_9ACTO|nr:twin-arginine translocase TatA/TatE family subunit [Actinomyces oris]OLL14361.1 Sec-independent protein translocase TatB [Actinomyces oris]OLO57093.1 Sec-independent protein translocase TatB [Actinomyces oris]
MFGINGSEFLVIILVAVIVVGPQRLPEYTRKLTQMVRQLRVFLDNARSQIAEEVGPEMADLDLSSLDPRQYDPRKIVRDALGEDIDAIREDLTHPFRSVGSAAKEISDDAAQAVNDVVKQDRAASLSKQIEAKRDAQLAENDAETAENSESTESSESPQSAEQSSDSIPPRGVLQQANDAEPEAASESAESVESAEATDGPDETEPEKTEVEQSEDAEQTEQPTEPEPVEVPTSLVEPQATASGEESGDAATAGDDTRTRVRPLSPRDIVRAANAAARTRAEAARVAVDFRPG